MVLFKYEEEFYYFVGIDPSWTGRKPTAVVVVKLNNQVKKFELQRYIYTKNIKEIVETISSLEKPSVIGVDAPLVITNMYGHRENELEFLRKYPIKIPLYPVNSSLYKSFFPTTLYKELNKIGFSFENHNIFEVYPHATLGALFFGRLFSYKRGKKEERLTRLKVIEEKVSQYVDFPNISFKSLKEREDCDDALICALTVFLPTTENSLVFGSSSDGLLLVPFPRFTQENREELDNS
ncbi:DUF429 domain-containing protein [Fervidobacterium pennivorans subsp. shakshaketiis]|uniref:DUF429 domain-containing protein n=1 Tax=Fervidobacterium pennivorans (strain DSM 9078 / Ven5) TaxID=771875 RepID=H9UDQ4_FERPD|nr:DUF429 domain-containing protein [Fervidobacterium pennivorans]AFG35647.1 hypothetical protein Ferpe_1588 [Fervidobacterium pennivorans DSM 9078]QIV78745.1 DUF429 domain-containing protein [Fervidobacterium pennivorans subsp. keratinolyticus]